MTQDERRVWLIEYLLKEQVSMQKPAVPTDVEGQQNLLRALMNIRLPMPVSDEFLEMQDAYLQERVRERGVTDAGSLLPLAYEGNTELCVWQGDITSLKCDAIVNACNSQMLGCFSPLHSCIDNFIHTYSGVELRLAMHDIMQAQGHEEPTGQAKITSAYNLPSRYVLHTVGPIIQWEVTPEDVELLASCYRECLKLAAANGVQSIAFCCLSTGVFRFPQQLAAETALSTVRDYLRSQNSGGQGSDNDVSNDICTYSGDSYYSIQGTGNIQQVIFNVFKEEDLRIYTDLLSNG